MDGPQGAEALRRSTGSPRPGELEEGGGGPPRVTTSAVVFAYDNAEGLRALIPELLRTPIDQLVVMYGGADGSRQLIGAMADPRLVTVFEEQRTGKWDAFNRALSRVTGEVVFLISGDVRCPPETLAKLREHVDGGAGIAFPRVVPTNVKGYATRVGARLWSLRDAQHVEAGRRGLPLHGGEVQAVRRELLETIPPLVNEDAWLCLRATERGFRVVYARDAVVTNTVPETVRDLLRQRTRINYGHFQLWRRGYLPCTLDTLLVRRPRLFLRIFGEAVLTDRRELGTLPLLALLEGLALVRGFIDHRRGRDYTRWPLMRPAGGVAA